MTHSAISPTRDEPPQLGTPQVDAPEDRGLLPFLQESSTRNTSATKTPYNTLKTFFALRKRLKTTPDSTESALTTTDYGTVLASGDHALDLARLQQLAKAKVRDPGVVRHAREVRRALRNLRLREFPEPSAQRLLTREHASAFPSWSELKIVMLSPLLSQSLRPARSVPLSHAVSQRNS